MQIVDYESMSVTVPLPTMLAQVWVIRVQVRVGVLDLFRVGRRPEVSRQARPEQGQAAEHEERGGDPGRTAEPAGQRIGDEPAGV